VVRRRDHGRRPRRPGLPRVRRTPGEARPVPGRWGRASRRHRPPAAPAAVLRPRRRPGDLEPPVPVPARWRPAGQPRPRARRHHLDDVPARGHLVRRLDRRARRERTDHPRRADRHHPGLQPQARRPAL